MTCFKAFIVLQMNSVLLKHSNTEGGQACCLMRERGKKSVVNTKIKTRPGF